MQNPFHNLKRWFQKNTSDEATDLTMRQVLSVSQPKSFPSWKQWKQLPSTLSDPEKRMMQSALFLIVISIATLITSYVLTHRVEVPTVGGAYTEGLVGEPQFINPLYASTNDVDADLASLVYSGLLRLEPGQGLVPDLAESFQINEEGTIYTLKIRENAKFHNNEDVRARDVLFTISAIQNSAYRSPLAPRFSGVSVVQDDDRTISFILEEANATFAEELTVGILPASIWAEILPQNAPLAALNLQPIGSGPYKFAEFAKDKKGFILSYTLEPHLGYYRNSAKIERLTFKFYPDSAALIDAFENKNIEGVSFVPFAYQATIEDRKTIELHRPYLPQEIVLFFNEETNENLKDLAVRSAIAHAIDKSALVNDILNSHARTIEGPILPGMTGFDETLQGPQWDIEKARAFISEANIATEIVASEEGEGGEGLGAGDEIEVEASSVKLSLSLTTVDSPEFIAVAELIKQQLAQIDVEIEVFRVPAESFFLEVIEPKNFELLLTAVKLGHDPDPYVFWHSSQSDGNGLNITNYSNSKVDDLLKKARETISTAERNPLYRAFQKELLEDVPAVFLYQSTYLYAVPKKIEGIKLEQINVPSDRFANITDWFIKTKKALQ